MDNPKVKLGDLLRAFEEAFYAGYEAALSGETKERAFNAWVSEEYTRLGLDSEDGPA